MDLVIYNGPLKDIDSEDTNVSYRLAETGMWMVRKMILLPLSLKGTRSIRIRITLPSKRNDGLNPYFDFVMFIFPEGVWIHGMGR